MTEQSKIPNNEAAGKGESVIERAGLGFGSEKFRPAPVPDHLRRAGQPRRKVEAGPSPAAKTVPRGRKDNGTGEGNRHITSAGQEKVSASPGLILGGPVHEIDRDLLAANGLILPEGQVSGLLEEFRIVKRRALNAMRKAQDAGAGGEAQRILMCSPLPDEGKSFCAVNLALALAAEKDSEVLLVDADFAKPSILSLLGLPGGDGLMDVLANPDVRLSECILRTDIAGLSVLGAGNHTNSDSEFLASNRTGYVLDVLTRGAPNRIVIFDSPPALAASPAAELAHHCGQAIVIARADKTGQSALEDALTLLSACPDIKLLLNAAHFSPSGRRFGAYYGQEG